MTHCEVQIASALSWADAAFAAAAEPKRVKTLFNDDVQSGRLPGALWQASIEELQPESTYDLRVRGCNKAGAGAWLQQQMTTSVRPAAPLSLICTQRRCDGMDLKWQVAYQNIYQV